MAASLRAEKKQKASDKCIASITFPGGRQVTTNVGILEALGTYYQGLLPREPGLGSARFDCYLADFPRLEATEAAGCEGLITEDEIWEALKQIGRDRAPGIDGLPYEIYLRQSPVFVLLLSFVYNNWYKNRSIP